MSEALGRRISVGLASRVNDDGEVMLKTAAPIVQTIVGCYMDGRVRTDSGDVWRASRMQIGDAEYVAVS